MIGWVKGRWLAGFVWGAALGPIGWIVIALSKAALRECPECGRRNRPDAKVCHYCGIDFRKYAGQTLAFAAQGPGRIASLVGLDRGAPRRHLLR